MTARLRLAALVLALAASVAPGAMAKPRLVSFSELDGWAADDHAAALKVFRGTCDLMKDAAWAPICHAAKSVRNPRAFLEKFLQPVELSRPKSTLFTGYYEPELLGSPTRSPRFPYPLYRKPPELKPGDRWYTRSEIETRGLLNGRGLEIAWLENPVDVFFLQVQGSGRIRLTDGRALRVGFAAKNGHPYKSVGKEMVRRGLLPANAVSAGGIRNWVTRNGADGLRILHHNPSFIFFRELDLPAELGPLGAMDRPVTPGRSLAVDPRAIPLGAPVWIEKRGKHPLRRLMIAQDTGSAIRGAGHVDIFVGTGEKAGDIAGTMRDGGRIVVLLPVETARALVRGN